MQQKLHSYNQETFNSNNFKLRQFKCDVLLDLQVWKQFQDLCSNKKVFTSPSIYTSIFQKEFQKFETTNMQSIVVLESTKKGLHVIMNSNPSYTSSKQGIFCGFESCTWLPHLVVVVVVGPRFPE